MNTLLEEVWLPVVGFEDVYQVSSLGDIKRIGRARGAKPGRILRPGLNRKEEGYLFVFLYENCVSKRHYVHRIVARAFHGPQPDGHEVNHKDGNKRNCCADNLEWVTKKENAVHSVQVLRHGLVGRTGEDHPSSRRFYVYPPSGEPFYVVGLPILCRKFGLDAGSMIRVSQGKFRHHHGWRCEYAGERPGKSSDKRTI